MLRFKPARGCKALLVRVVYGEIGQGVGKRGVEIAPLLRTDERGLVPSDLGGDSSVGYGVFLKAHGFEC